MRGFLWVLFAVRETVQESLGFSPAELVFVHQVRGPLKVLKEHLLSVDSSQSVNVLDYVSNFRDRLHAACSLARESLANVQKGMKRRFIVKRCTFLSCLGMKCLYFCPYLVHLYLLVLWTLSSEEENE